jgi:phthalate 4,5-cis-dihydrodiol dehydrogenase
MAERRLRLGVVGLGRAASSMLPSLAAHPGVDVVAAADPNPQARARFTADFGGRTYERAEALAGDAAVDALYIATPHQYHAPDVLAAAAHRKHVLVEKPMALSVEECRAMTQAAEAAGITLVVGPTHAFDPVVREMRRIIESGELGALRMIVNLVYSDFLYRPRRPEELDSARGGGIMYNQVPHQIEIARELDGGALRTVRAVTGVWDSNRPTEGAMTALLEFASGAAASLTYSGYDRFDSDEFAFWIAASGAHKVPAHGSARRALGVRNPDDEARLKAESGFAGRGVRLAGERLAGEPAHQPHFGMLLASCERGDLRPSADGVLVYGDRGVREIALPPGRTFPNKDGAIDELYQAVVHGVAPLHDGRWGTATLEAALALVASARERREIVLEAKPAYDAPVPRVF